jgi:hypothetical protein
MPRSCARAGFSLWFLGAVCTASSAAAWGCGSSAPAAASGRNSQTAVSVPAVAAPGSASASPATPAANSFASPAAGSPAGNGTAANGTAANGTAADPVSNGPAADSTSSGSPASGSAASSSVASSSVASSSVASSSAPSSSVAAGAASGKGTGDKGSADKGAADKGAAAEPAAPAPGEAVPGAASLYARLGDVLVPLACKGPHGWHTGRICLPDDEDATVNVTLQPVLKGETAVRSASSASIPFVLSGTEEPGLVMVDRERETAAANRPLLGFGLVGSNAQVRYTKAGALRVEQEVTAWCKVSRGACQGVATGSLARLVGRVGRAREQNDLVAQVRQAIAPLDEALPIKVIALFTVSVGGRPQRIADVEVETGKATGPKAAELQLPESVHFLLTETARGFRLNGVPREYGFGLGEAGELVAAIDLDADGTDELILSWTYSEGRSWELIRRSGDKLIFVGGFTDGA